MAHFPGQVRCSRMDFGRDQIDQLGSDHRRRFRLGPTGSDADFTALRSQRQPTARSGSLQ